MLACSAAAEPIPRILVPASVEIYGQAIRTDSTADVERLYRLGLRAADDLLSTLISGSSGYVLEGLSDEDYAATTERMKGFDLNRDEVVFVNAEPEFFANLARERKDKVSLDFFETTGQIGGEGSPTYLEQVTDYSACVRFGSLELVRCYRLLTRFRSLYPERYADRIATLLEPLEGELTDGNCACMERQDVEKELQAFLDEFPKSSIAVKVRDRLAAIRKGTVTMRYHCSPG
jgi:hypothetical protein